MISIKNLTKKYTSPDNEEIIIYENLNFEVATWEFISIMWPSGRGKTTLLNMISWLDIDYDWELLVNLIKLKNLSNDERTIFRWVNISYIFQDFNLIENLTVEENIDIVLDINNLKRRYTTSEILEKVWLGEKNKSYPYNLSWWEKQRVAIARAFVGETSVILADEPTGNLDEDNSKKIMDLLSKMQSESEISIVMITHSEEIAGYSQKIYEVEGHSIVIRNTLH